MIQSSNHANGEPDPKLLPDFQRVAKAIERREQGPFVVAGGIVVAVFLLGITAAGCLTVIGWLRFL